MTVYELPDFDWAVFDCYGPCPKALQDVNTKIWKEWMPGNPDFEFPGRVNIEWYGDGDPSASDYHAAIWIPVKKKGMLQQTVFISGLTCGGEWVIRDEYCDVNICAIIR